MKYRDYILNIIACSVELFQQSHGWKLRDLRHSRGQVLNPTGEHVAGLDVVWLRHGQEGVGGEGRAEDHGGRDGGKVRIVDTDDGHPSTSSRVVEDLPEVSRDWQHVPVVEEDGHQSVIDIPELDDATGAGVDGQVELPLHGKVPTVVLKRGPVPAVEGLPLRRHIDKPATLSRICSFLSVPQLPEGRILPALEDKVCVRCEMSSGEK